MLGLAMLLQVNFIADTTASYFGMHSTK